jgi:hypothetical protein
MSNATVNAFGDEVIKQMLDHYRDAVFIKEKLRSRQINFWIRSMHPGSLHCAECPGGGYSTFASLFPSDETGELLVKCWTVSGIMQHINQSKQVRFAFSDPTFPDNCHAFLKRLAAQCQRAYQLEHRRYWRNYARRRREWEMEHE